jgi:hypothetical protein
MTKALRIAVAAVAAILLLGFSTASAYVHGRVDLKVVDIDLPGGG